MASVTVKRHGKITIDLAKLAKVTAPAVVGDVLARVDEGKDTKDRALPEYSDLYKMQLAAIGENTKPDMRLSGGLMNSLGLLRAEVNGMVATLVFGPDTGTSPKKNLPPPWVFDPKVSAEERAERFEAWKKAPKKAGRSPPHNLVGLWLHRGDGNRPARPWLGISPAGMKRLRALVEKVGIFKSR